MSFLNALASDGLSVGLRIYTEKLNSRPNSPSAPSAVDEAEATSSVENNQLAPVAAVEKSYKSIPVRVETPEEIAANRIAAQAMLGAVASLGQLQATEAEKQAVTGVKISDSSKKSEDDGPVETTDKIVNNSLSSAPGVEKTPVSASTSNIETQEEIPAKGTSLDLSQEEQEEVDSMKDRDREVRQHEQAHVVASGGMAGTPVYQFQTGPDGRRYAAGGHVDIKTSGSSDPETALREAEMVKKAATAPAEPSGQDQAVAARAAADIQKIKAEKDVEESEEAEAGQADPQKADGPAAGGFGIKGNGLEDETRSKIFNGSSFGQQVLGAYAAVKSAVASQAVRSVLGTA